MYFLSLYCLFVTLLFYVGCSEGISTQNNINTRETTSEAAISTETTTNENSPLFPVFIGSANVAGANTETANIKSVASTYLIEKGTYPATSSDLIPKYFNKAINAKYYFNATTIIRVDSLAGGWANIVFSLSQQSWIKGSPDNDHPNDQDIP
jgi:hypothetical protein